ncbi:MAG TPA: hypothetical protein VG826_07970 [Pirellulales bacterium]|nr:hypothetical protein [Pirellulales bacterium]
MRQRQAPLPLVWAHLCVGVVLLSGCGKHPTPEQADVIAAIERLGGRVKCDDRQTVVEVALGGTQVSDAQLEKLGVFPELKTLSLFDSAVGDDGLAKLGPCPVLETLYLGRTRVTDAGVKQFVRFPTLKNLGLSDTRVSDAGIRQLASLANLRTINVHRTQVTVTGGNDLKAALPQLVIHY